MIDPYLILAVNGVKTDRTQFCIGETFTAECFIPQEDTYLAPAYDWTSSLFGTGPISSIRSSTIHNKELNFRGSLYIFMDTNKRSILKYTVSSQTFRYSILRCSRSYAFRSVVLLEYIEILGMQFFHLIIIAPKTSFWQSFLTYLLRIS